jgi:YHS domain-containing protein
MARFILIAILFIIISRMFWRLVDSFVEGVTGESRQSRQSRMSGAPQHGVAMARDPVCGTFVIPERAVTLVNGRTRLYFCSDACRDKYRAKTA